MISDLETTGGAAVAASRLATGLAVEGAEVVRVVGTSGGGQHPWRTVVVAPEATLAPGGLLGRLRARLTARAGPRWLPDLLREAAPDVINVHNVHAAGWDPRLIEACVNRAPTVWTLHDMWSFSGRCAYSYDCVKFMTGCDATCPTPDEYPALPPARIAAAWRTRRRLFRAHPELIAVCPSRWLARTARAGLWRHHRIEVIPYGVPLGIYRPVDRVQARAALRLKTDGIVVSFVAQLLTDRRKGGAILPQALQAARNRPFTLLTAGHGSLDVASEGLEVCALGFVEDDHTRVLAYSAADVMVHPAPVDNLPNVVMETIACGTPCVGYPIGGVAEMVRPRVTGWLADDVTPHALGAAIDRAIVDVRGGLALRASCRRVAEREYDDRLQARRYLDLFESLMGTERYGHRQRQESQW